MPLYAEELQAAATQQVTMSLTVDGSSAANPEKERSYES
jgi:hypothetical protein